MFIAFQNINSFPVFYIGSSSELPKPGKYNLELRKATIRLQQPLKNKRFGREIYYNQISSVQVTYDIKDKKFSVGRALGGDLLVGPIGVAAGLSGNNKKVEAALTIKYDVFQGEPAEFTMITKRAEHIKKLIDRRSGTVK